MRGNTSSPAITHVTAGDAFSAPRLPPHAPLPAGCQTAFQQNHTFDHAKPYVSQTRNTRTALRSVRHGHTKMAHGSKKTETEKSTKANNHLFLNNLPRQKEYFKLRAHTRFAVMPKHSLRCRTESALGRDFGLCPSANASPQSQNLFITQKREPQSPLFCLSS